MSSFIFKSKSNRLFLPSLEEKCLFPFPCYRLSIPTPAVAFQGTGTVSILPQTVKLKALSMSRCQKEEDENVHVGVLLSPNISLVYPQPSQSCNTEIPVLSPADYS